MLYFAQQPTSSTSSLATYMGKGGAAFCIDSTARRQYHEMHCALCKPASYYYIYIYISNIYIFYRTQPWHNIYYIVYSKAPTKRGWISFLPPIRITKRWYTVRSGGGRGDQCRPVFKVPACFGARICIIKHSFIPFRERSAYPSKRASSEMMLRLMQASFRRIDATECLLDARSCRRMGQPHSQRQPAVRP